MPIASVPTNPLGLCHLEVLVLNDLAVSRLSELQVQSIRQWVVAGGKLIFVGPKRLVGLPNKPLMNWLRKALIHSKRGLSDSGLILTDVELGCVALVDKQLFEQQSAENTIRNKLTDIFWRCGPLDLRPHQSMNVMRLAQPLLPTNVRVVPSYLLALLFGVFVLLIGRFEYVWLGRLGRRWLTWLTFPITILLFSVITFALGDAYLDAESLKTLSIIDLGSDGSPLRETRLECRFGKENGDVVTDRKDCLVVPLSQRGNQTIGNYPLNYQTIDRALRWTPRFERQTRIAQVHRDSKILKPIDWTEFSPETSGKSLVLLLKRLKEHYPLHEIALVDPLDSVIHSTKAHLYDDSLGLWHSPRYQGYRNHRSNVLLPTMASPAGGPLLRDLPITGRFQWLLFESDGDHQRIYRHTYPRSHE